MISFWLSIILIIIASGILVLVIKLIFSKTRCFKNDKDLLLLFFVFAACMYLYTTIQCVNLCVVKNNEITNRYIQLFDTSYKFQNGTSIEITKAHQKSFFLIINDSSDCIFFDLIGYSKEGDTTIGYGHKNIMPYSISPVNQYPDFIFSTPDKEVKVSSNYSSNQIVTKGWLHKTAH